MLPSQIEKIQAGARRSWAVQAQAEGASVGSQLHDRLAARPLYDLAVGPELVAGPGLAGLDRTWRRRRPAQTGQSGGRFPTQSVAGLAADVLEQLDDGAPLARLGLAAGGQGLDDAERRLDRLVAQGGGQGTSQVGERHHRMVGEPVDGRGPHSFVGIGEGSRRRPRCGVGGVARLGHRGDGGLPGSRVDAPTPGGSLGAGLAVPVFRGPPSARFFPVVPAAPVDDNAGLGAGAGRSRAVSAASRTSGFGSAASRPSSSLSPRRPAASAARARRRGSGDPAATATRASARGSWPRARATRAVPRSSVCASGTGDASAAASAAWAFVEPTAAPAFEDAAGAADPVPPFCGAAAGAPARSARAAPRSGSGSQAPTASMAVTLTPARRSASRASSRGRQVAGTGALPPPTSTAPARSASTTDPAAGSSSSGARAARSSPPVPTRPRPRAAQALTSGSGSPASFRSSGRAAGRGSRARA